MFSAEHACSLHGSSCVGGGGGREEAGQQASSLIAKQLQAVEFPQVLAYLSTSLSGHFHAKSGILR